MNQLEQFREQCAKVANKFVGTEQIVEEIRALPLPEVNQEPVAYMANEPLGDYDNWILTCPSLNPGAMPLYALPPDAEALRKENEQLKESLLYTIDQVIGWQEFATGCEQDETEEMKEAKKLANWEEFLKMREQNSAE